MARFLTEAEKASEVARWLTYRSDPMNQAPPGREGGYGYPDPDIFSLTDALNGIPGVLTDQSCAGHLYEGEEPGDDAMRSGQLWLRLSEPMMLLWTSEVYRLYAHPTIERCQRIFHKDVGDIADIVFQGNNTGRLAESSAVILSFFQSLEGGWSRLPRVVQEVARQPCRQSPRHCKVKGAHPSHSTCAVVGCLDRGIGHMTPHRVMVFG